MKDVIDIKVYKYFADIVYEKTGILYPEKDYYRLDSRINTLKKEYECANANEVYEKFKNTSSPKMMSFLIDICTNNETYFFRDEKPFNALTKEIIPKILAKNNNGPISMWSCASSTGQEPLSIMMSIKEKCPTLAASHVKFQATDISTRALDKATKGIYSGLDVQRGLPITLLVKYFASLEDNQWEAKAEIRNPIEYGSFNLLTGNFPKNKYDIIFCRNVLIYQNRENKNAILANIVAALNPGGYLFLGAGESLIGTTTPLVQETVEQALVFVKPL